MKEKEDLKLYKISADGGHSYTEQWMTESEKASTRMAHTDWLIIESKITPIKEAIYTMGHWLEYEKKHKDKIKNAEELIEIQETILNHIKAQDRAIYEILEKLNEKEREMNECDDSSISEQEAQGYLSGINHARVIIEEEIEFVKGGGRYA